MRAPAQVDALNPLDPGRDLPFVGAPFTLLLFLARSAPRSARIPWSRATLDKNLLAHGPWSAIEAAALQCLREGACRCHIFNLSHGLLRETPSNTSLASSDSSAISAPTDRERDAIASAIPLV